ncbi:hypothetical protein LOD99_10919 [Oopsacas minuta]|uniref:Death domain-containing protein n=1 Tax=Oopsacas minuta TaxID=111878 RepID=A0AAV7KCB7_9METZ|nr:hypothetical protein LOD99_10919 [Oopsacas minuta]
MEMLQSFYLSDLGDGSDFKGFSVLTEGIYRIDGANEIIPNKANIKCITSSLHSLGFTVRQIDTTNTDENIVNFDGSRADKLLTQLPREIEIFQLDKQRVDWFIFYYTGFIIDNNFIMPWGVTSIVQLIQDINDLLVGIPKMFLFECTHMYGPERDYVMDTLGNISGGDYILCFSTEYGYGSYHGEVSWWTEHLSKQLVSSCKLNYSMVESMESLRLQFNQTKFNKSNSKVGSPKYIDRLSKILKFPQFEPVPDLELAIPSPLHKEVSVFILCAHEGYSEGDPYLFRLTDILYQMGFVVESDLYFIQGDLSLNQWIVNCIENCDYTMIVGSPILKALMTDGQNQPISHDNRTLFFSGSVVYSNLLNPKFTKKLIPIVIHDCYMSYTPERLFPSPINGNEIYYFKEIPDSPAHLRFSLRSPDFTKVFCRMREIKLRPGMKNPFNYVDIHSDYLPRKIINCSIDPNLVSCLDEDIGNEIGELGCIVSEGLQKSEWKFLARQLGLKEGKISEIEYDWERDGLQEVKVKMIVAWRNQDDNATYKKLCNSLRMIQCNSVVVEVHKFMASFFKK